MNSETLMKIENIILQRGGATVLDISEFHVKCGRILALIGPNGAGKSTLLLMLAGLLKPRQGKVYFAERAAAAQKCVDAGWLLVAPDRLRLTVTGFLFADEVSGRLWLGT